MSCGFYPKAFQAEVVLLLPAPVRLSLCLWTLPCPHDNLSQFLAGITKFASNMHHGIYSQLILEIEVIDLDLQGNFNHFELTFRIVRNLACPYNSSQIWAAITKFAPNMPPGILLAGVGNKGHLLWSSKPFWLRILGNLTGPCNGL